MRLDEVRAHFPRCGAVSEALKKAVMEAHDGLSSLKKEAN